MDSIKACVEFYETAQVPAQTKSLGQTDDDKLTADIRALIAEGQTQGVGKQYAQTVREHLSKRVRAFLKEDEWIFSGEKGEQGV